MNLDVAKHAKAFASKKMLLWVWAPILLISLLHYTTSSDHSLHWIHDVARRLYYLPIIGGAFILGSRGSLIAALVVTLAYLPHAFSGLMPSDPARGLEKALEILLYIAVAGVTGILVDRERRERVKQAALAQALSRSLKEKERMADQLIRSGRLTALGELTAGIAHEIRNPLHAMGGTAEILGDSLPKEGTAQDMLQRHRGEIDRLSRLLDRFLAFARPSDPTLTPLDPAEVLDHAIDLIDAQARKEGVVIERGAIQRGARVEGDRDLLVQVCLGIALNAIQIMSEQVGEKALRVEGERVQSEGDGRYVLRWSNTGPPIPDALIERIFDPFVTTRPEGTGLGLPIAARIIDLHGGEIRVIQKGPPSLVTFEIGLPLS